MPPFTTPKAPRLPVATRPALDLAKQIAEDLGIAFDEAAIIEEACTLDQAIFADLTRALALDGEALRLEAGLYGSARLLVSRDETQTAVVVLDIVFGFCIEALTLLGAIATFETLSEAELQDVAQRAAALLDLF